MVWCASFVQFLASLCDSPSAYVSPTWRPTLPGHGSTFTGRSGAVQCISPGSGWGTFMVPCLPFTVDLPRIPRLLWQAIAVINCRQCVFPRLDCSLIV
ncbi:hypothetical protein BDV95DRAFT_327941 [Massariosphaeria phaeospora]|uniref:Sushi domain-containing protein n=1 Tax=Massariosphaeria phaeospora TaxID=100035 RepID=A0A7C8IDB2_9PLEO|nr:hypothetical protein BDV95DRAFT_327941 [Massariosphaeria phaeospora]